MSKSLICCGQLGTWRYNFNLSCTGCYDLCTWDKIATLATNERFVVFIQGNNVNSQSCVRIANAKKTMKSMSCQ